MNEFGLKKQIQSSFDVRHFDDTIYIEKKAGDCETLLKTGCVELMVTKVKEMEGNKFLIQLSIFEKYVVLLDNRMNLIEVPKQKIINCVLDVDKNILQIRTSRNWVRICMLFFEKLFKVGRFIPITFDEPLIDALKQKLTGKTYEYVGTKKKIEVAEILNDIDNGMANRLNKPFIHRKNLKKLNMIPLDIRNSPDFPMETTHYNLAKDLFDFECPAELTTVEESIKLELAVYYSRLFFRKFATESVIDYVLDCLIAVIPLWSAYQPPKSLPGQLEEKQQVI
jgi:hypothetical protein